MALLTTLPDYSDRDFDSLRFRLRNLIRSVFPEWTDFNVANFGNLLLELFAHVGDVLGFYQDNQARQSRITTATQRRAILGLVKLIGYVPSSATPATVDVTLTLSATPAGTVVLPAGTVVLTEEVTAPIRYQTLADVTIPAGANPPQAVVSCENSETVEEVFASTALPNQALVLGSTPYIDHTAVVVAGDGAYAQVDNFLESLPGDKHFTAAVDQNDRATFTFGNGVNGGIPIGNVTVGYKTGGGVAGRVELGKLKRVEGAFVDSLGNSVAVTANNALASAGGTDRQSVAQIKERAPASIRAISRTVAREDFEINALRRADVARALMLTSNEDSGVAENSGILYIVPVGGGTASLALLDAVKATFVPLVAGDTPAYPCTLTFNLDVRTSVYQAIDVFAVVYFRKGVTKAAVAASIRAVLTAFFAVQNADGTSNANVDFGGNVVAADGSNDAELSLSDVYNVVRDVAGVRKMGPAASDFTLNGLHDDVTLAKNAFPKLGTVSLFDGDTGQPL